MAKYTKTAWHAGRLITRNDMEKIEDQFEMITPGATNVAENYKSSETYSKGDYCLYDGELWKCIATPVGTDEEKKPKDSSAYWTKTKIMNETNSGISQSIANEYKENQNYEIGDYVTYHTDLYRCIEATHGAWNSQKWELVILSNDITDLISVQNQQPDNDVNKIWIKKTGDSEVTLLTKDDIEESYCKTDTIAPTFSESDTYAVGEYVYYDGTLYRFTADHVAGAWTGTDASEAVIGQDVSELKSALYDIYIKQELTTASTGSPHPEVFAFAIEANEMYKFTNNTNDTVNIRTVDENEDTIEIVAGTLNVGGSVEFTASLSASYVRIYYGSASGGTVTVISGLPFDLENTQNEIEELSQLTDSKISQIEEKISSSGTDIDVKAIMLADFRQTGKLSLYSPPTGYEWLNECVTLLTDGKKFIIAENKIDQYKLTGGTTYYVDSVNGNNNNDGLSETTAFQTASKAYSVTNNNDTIYFIDAENTVLEYQAGVVSGDLTKSLNWIAKNNIVFKCGANYEFVSSGGIWKTNRSGVRRVVDMAYFNEGVEYSKVQDLTTCQSMPGSWYQNDSDLYINTISGQIPDKRICVIVYGGFHFVDASVYMENITIVGGAYNYGPMHCTASQSGSEATVAAKNCKFLYGCGNSGSKNAVSVQGYKTAFFVDCVSAFSLSDGFNYSVTGSSAPNYVEINCTGHDNGDNSVSGNVNNNNGSTGHNGTNGVRINGSYYNNMGPNIGEASANSVNLGCVVYDSHSVSLDYNADFLASGDSLLWIQGCVVNGNSDFNIYAATGTTINVKNCIYDTTHGGGTINVIN